MSDIENVRQHQIAFLDEAKSRIEPFVCTVQGVEIQVNPSVFPPATDTQLLAVYIRTKQGERVLDLTTGSGAFALIAGLQGATGIAVDINPLAVANARENFKKYGVGMEAVQSDLFGHVPNEKFDQIFVNGPFFEGDIVEPLDYACYGMRSFYKRLFFRSHVLSEVQREDVSSFF